MGLKKRSTSFAKSAYIKTIGSKYMNNLIKTNFYKGIREQVFTIIYLLIFLGLSAGVVNAMLEGTKPQYLYSIILPSRNAQTWAETTINFFTIAFGSIGFYLMYIGGKQSERRRSSEFYIIFGLVLLFIAFFIGLTLLTQKGIF